ncbi:MAG: GspH/FimT family pseudopilin [Gammaproteobacteria bacterium]|jgi:type IV fimbrial biogenesis protein FimT
MRQDHKASGITLIESLTTLVILAILIRLMLPDLAQLLEQRQGSLVIQRVANSIFLARAAAAKSGTMAVLCPSQDGNYCGGEWHDGILLFLDWNDNQTPDSGDETVDYLRFEKLPGTLHWRAFRSKPYLQITPLGFTRYQNGNFTWCGKENTSASARQLVLNRTGRVRYAQDRDGDGLREDSSGRPIQCPR